MKKATFYRVITFIGLSLVVLGTGNSFKAKATSPPTIHLLQPYDTEGKAALKKDESFNKNGKTLYCPVTAFETPGQAWSIGLTTGGMSFESTNRYNGKTVMPIFSEIDLTGFDTASGKTAIIVIDHFAPFQIIMDEDGQGGKVPVTNFRPRHGNLVIAHMRSLLKSANYEYLPGLLLTMKKGSHSITIYRIEMGKADISNNEPEYLETSQLVKILQGNIRSIEADNYIFNMSFAILPCEIMNNYREIRQQWYDSSPSKRYTFTRYLQELKSLNNSVNNIVDDKVIQSILTDISDKEPFTKWYKANIPDLKKRKSVVMVASSSNFGLNYSTAPAIWQDVISVGAVDAKWRPVVSIEPGSIQKNYWSSSSDVRTVGEWFKLPYREINEFCIHGETCIADDVLPNKTSQPPRYYDFAYRGTSFSAPSVTAYLATLSSDSQCFSKIGTGFTLVKKQNPPAPPASLNIILFTNSLNLASCR